MIWFLSAVVGGLLAFVCLLSSELRSVNQRAKALTRRVVQLEGENTEYRNRCAACQDPAQVVAHE